MTKQIFYRLVDNENMNLVRTIEVVKYRDTPEADYWINVDEQYLESPDEDKREKTFSSIHLTKDEMVELFLNLKNELYPEEAYRHMSSEEWKVYVEKNGVRLDRPADEDPEPNE